MTTCTNFTFYKIRWSFRGPFFQQEIQRLVLVCHEDHDGKFLLRSGLLECGCFEQSVFCHLWYILSRRHEGFWGLNPQAKLQAPQIYLWSTINRWSFYQISECKATNWKLSDGGSGCISSTYINKRIVKTNQRLLFWENYFQLWIKSWLMLLPLNVYSLKNYMRRI